MDKKAVMHNIMMTVPLESAERMFLASLGQPSREESQRGRGGGSRGRRGRGSVQHGRVERVHGRGGRGRGSGRAGRARRHAQGAGTSGLSLIRPVPVWQDYQLVGDSMMARLGAHLTKDKATYNQDLKAYQLGLCVGGQTAGQLNRLLKSKNCPPIGDKVCLMIGTNNVLKGVPLEDSLRALDEVLKHFMERTKHLIISTIPPIPKHADKPEKMDVLKKLNEHILKMEKSDQVTVSNYGQLFFNDQQTINLEFYDRDALHWNEAGMEAVKSQLQEDFLLSGIASM